MNKESRASPTPIPLSLITILPLNWPQLLDIYRTQKGGSGTEEMILPSPFVGEGNGTPLQYSCLEN